MEESCRQMLAIAHRGNLSACVHAWRRVQRPRQTYVWPIRQLLAVADRATVADRAGFELYPRSLCRCIELAILITLNVALILVHCMRACVAKGATTATDICLVHPQELPHLRRQLPRADRWCGQWARGHLRAENTACENAT